MKHVLNAVLVATLATPVVWGSYNIYGYLTHSLESCEVSAERAYNIIKEHDFNYLSLINDSNAWLEWETEHYRYKVCSTKNDMSHTKYSKIQGDYK